MQEYKIQQSNIEYLIRLIDKHGFDILRTSKNRYYEPYKKEETQEEKIKRLESENLYLKAELEYSKKLRAVIQARKKQQQKIK